MANLKASDGGVSLRIAFAGTPDFAVPALQRLIASQHDVRLVFTQPDRPRGRGQRVQFSPVKTVAQDHGVPVHQPAVMGADTVALMRQEAIDVLVVAAYGQIVSQAVLDAPQYGCLNIHASLLPRWRGAAPVVYALLAGDDETGVTIMQMEAGLDSGPILYQQQLNILPAMHQLALLQALAKLGAQSIDAVLARLSHYQSRAHPQEADGVLYAPKINKKQAQVDWSGPAVAIDRHVRAFYGAPMAYTFHGDTRIRIVEVCAGQEKSNSSFPSGAVVAVTPSGVEVACGDGVVLVTCLQMPGAKPQMVADNHGYFEQLFMNARFSAPAG